MLMMLGCNMVSNNPPLTGKWRSILVEMTLDGQGGTIVFGCATGTISQPVKPDSNGVFSVAGTYTQLSGAQPPTPPAPQPATYSGKVVVDKLTLSGKLKDGTSIGPIEVVKDSPQQVLICP